VLSHMLRKFDTRAVYTRSYKLTSAPNQATSLVCRESRATGLMIPGGRIVAEDSEVIREEAIE
jgi:hypothetical protein